MPRQSGIVRRAELGVQVELHDSGNTRLRVNLVTPRRSAAVWSVKMSLTLCRRGLLRVTSDFPLALWTS